MAAAIRIVKHKLAEGQTKKHYKVAKMKILVAGDIDGKVDILFSRVGNIIRKVGAFDALLCIGQFLPISENGNPGLGDIASYIDGSKSVPIPTYFCSCTPLEDNLIESHARTDITCVKPRGMALGTVAPLCNNLTCVGRAGVFQLCGLSVGFLSGSVRSDGSEILEREAIDHGPVDILCSQCWPRGLLKNIKFDRVPPGIALTPTSFDPEVSRAVASLRPRYHFAATESVYYERLPYSHDAPMIHLTRFIGLGKVAPAAEKPSKYIYALDLVGFNQCTREVLLRRPELFTRSPFRDAPTIQYGGKNFHASLQPEEEKKNTDNKGKEEEKRDRVDGGKKDVTLVAPPFDVKALPSGAQDDLPAPKRARTEDGTPAPFWTLSAIPEAPAATTDPIVPNQANIEQPWRYNFNALPGGGGGRRRGGRGEEETRPDCWFCLSSAKVEKHLIVSIGEECYLAMAKGGLNRFHVLIIPIEHTGSAVECGESVIQEMRKFVNALRRCFAAEGLDTLVFERNIPTRGPRHMQWQVIPLMPKALDMAEELYFQEGREIGIKFERLSKEVEIGDVESAGLTSDDYYFFVDLGSDGPQLLYRVDGRAPPGLMSFGRLVVAKLLGDPTKADWKICQLTPVNEEIVTREFKALFRDHDFTL